MIWRFHCFHFFRGQFQAERRHCVINVFHFGCSQNRSRDSWLLQHPGHGHLSILHAALLGHFGNPVNDDEVLRMIVVIVRIGVVVGAEGFSAPFTLAIAGHKTTGQGAIRNHRNPFGPAHGNHFAFVFAIQQIVIALHAGEARQMPGIAGHQHFHELPCEHSGPADIARFAGFDDIIQRIQRFFDRRIVIKAMNLIKIDEIGPQPPQT